MLKQIGIILFGIFLLSAFVFIVVESSQKIFKSERPELSSSVSQPNNSGKNTAQNIPGDESLNLSKYSNGSISIGEVVSNLPDINSSECGYYYSEYGICGGVCESGSCISEGKSCYCSKT